METQRVSRLIQKDLSAILFKVIKIQRDNDLNYTCYGVKDFSVANIY